LACLNSIHLAVAGILVACPFVGLSAADTLIQYKVLQEAYFVINAFGSHQNMPVIDQAM
jgi:hypothetical protein